MSGRGKLASASFAAAVAAAVLALPAFSGPIQLPRDPIVCKPATGVVSIRSAGQYSHLVDSVEVGHRQANNTLRVHYAGASKDEGPYNVTEDCTTAGEWKRIVASMNSGADIVRLDADELPAEFKPVPVSIAAKLSGGGTRDQLLGHAGPDELRGGASFDTLKGFEGEDVLVGGERADAMLAGSGDDVVRAADGGNHGDKVRCGKGDDVAIVDPPDEPRGCEKVKRG